MIFGMSYYEVGIYFLLYSFLGWCVEVVFQTVKTKSIINRGFMNGPVCPVYGFGILAVFVACFYMLPEGTSMAKAGIISIYIIGVILATLVELIGGFALYNCFHARWWDYSGERYNFHGYICPLFSCIWGVGIVLVVKLVHPFLSDLILGLIPEGLGRWILVACYAIFVFDFLITVMFMLQLNKEIEELETIRSDLRIVSDKLSKSLAEKTMHAEEILEDEESLPNRTRVMIKEFAEEKEKSAYIRNQLEEKLALEERMQTWKENFKKRNHFVAQRIYKAYPNMKSGRYGETLKHIRSYLYK